MDMYACMLFMLVCYIMFVWYVCIVCSRSYRCVLGILGRGGGPHGDYLANLEQRLLRKNHIGHRIRKQIQQNS